MDLAAVATGTGNPRLELRFRGPTQDGRTRMLTLIDEYSRSLDQTVPCDFIADGHLGRRLRLMRDLYASRTTYDLQRSR